MADDDLTVEDTSGYKAPEKVDLDTLKNKDADDESLNKWKAQLLAGQEGAASGDKRLVVLKKLSVVVEGRDDVTLDLTHPAEELKKFNPAIKEGTSYRIKLEFNVQNEVVAGLKYVHAVYRSGVRVDKDNFMVGSYGPRGESYSWTGPVEEAPSGMMARGHYTIKSKFTDDDKNEHLIWEWALDIKKKWPEEKGGE